MEEKNERLVHRICPCFAHDMEGIQTWLEDMAKEGLMMEPEGRTLTVFSFRRGAPQNVRYRLEAVAPRGLWSASDGPDWEMRKTFAQMGWKYLDYFGSFHIYRCDNPQAPELNTDPTVQATTLQSLKDHQKSAATHAVLYPLFYTLITNRAISPFRLAVTAGSWLPLSIIGFLLWAFVSSVCTIIRLGRYQRRLKAGEALTVRKDWKKSSHTAKWLRLLPGSLVLIMLLSLGSLLLKTAERQPLDAAPDELPFVTLEEIFPEAEIARMGTSMDYNTFMAYDNALSSNYEWNEVGDVKLEDGVYYCLVRMDFHDSAAPWLAKHTARDYYRYEQRRYNSKRFEDEISPDTAFDTLYVFRSYGILHIVGQEGKQIFHATVQFSDPNKEPCWELWLRAMEGKLCQ